MPQTDHPLAFGQHSNSDMAASIDDANTLIDVLVSLQPRVVKVRPGAHFIAPYP
jgi:dynein heavy chain